MPERANTACPRRRHEFDLQAVWTTAGASAAILVIGYVWGFLQSIVPFIPTTGNLRNVVLTALCAALVLVAALDSGKTLDDPDALTNVFGGFLVFLGLQRMSIASADAGTFTAVKTAGGEKIEVSPPDTTVPTPPGG